MNTVPEEFNKTRTAIGYEIVERIITCKCGATIRTSCDEYTCPICNTPLVFYGDYKNNVHLLFDYSPNKNYCKEFAKWAFQKAEAERKKEKISELIN